jgi:hypothetical protein
VTRESPRAGDASCAVAREPGEEVMVFTDSLRQYDSRVFELRQRHRPGLPEDAIFAYTGAMFTHLQEMLQP